MVMAATNETFSLAPAGRLERTAEEKEKPIEDVVKERAEYFLKELPPNAERKQAIGNLLTNALVTLHNSTDDIDLINGEAKKYQTILRAAYPGNDEQWEIARSGFLAETAFCLAMQEAGFEVFSPSAEDDLKGKVDMWLDAGDGTVLAVQLKSEASFEEPLMLPLQLSADEQIKGFPGILPAQYAENCKTMLQYSAEQGHRMPEDTDIISVFIVIPGGLNTETSSFHSVTGSPSKFVKYTNQDGKTLEGPLHEAILESFYMTIWKE